MTTIYTGPAEFTRKPNAKGGKRTRLGPRTNTTLQVNQEKTRPDQIAGNKLVKALKKLNYTDKDAQNKRAIVIEWPQLRYMNMEVLASVLAYIDTMRRYNNGLENSQTFTTDFTTPERLHPFIYRLLPSLNKEGVPETNVDRQIEFLRMKANFLRYLTYYYIIAGNRARSTATVEPTAITYE